MKLFIQLENGTASGKRFAFAGRGVRIGSAANCEVHLDDPGIPPYAASIISKEGQLVAFPTGQTQVLLGDKNVQNSGMVWQPGQTLRIGNCNLQLVVDRPKEHKSELPRVHNATQPQTTSKPVAPQTGSQGATKTKSDLPQYAIITVILCGALGIILLPDSKPETSGTTATVGIKEILTELDTVKESVPRLPTLSQIREQLVSARLAENNRQIARKRYDAALSMLMKREVGPNTSKAGEVNFGKDDPKRTYKSPVLFETELEYKIYSHLRAKLPPPPQAK